MLNTNLHSPSIAFLPSTLCPEKLVVAYQQGCSKMREKVNAPARKKTRNLPPSLGQSYPSVDAQRPVINAQIHTNSIG